MAYIHLYPPMSSWDIQEIRLKGNLQYTHLFDNLSEIYWKTPKSTGSSWFIISLLKDVRLVEFSRETPKYHVLICIVVTTCSPYSCPHQMSYVNSCPSTSTSGPKKTRCQRLVQAARYSNSWLCSAA